MTENLKDILAHLSTQLDQETLLRYLQGSLTKEQQHEVEKTMLAGDFENDALEGLQAIQNKEQIAFVVEQLNRELRRKLEKKKKRREKLRFKDQPGLYIALLIILLLIVISYLVIHRMLQSP